jgi:3D (Asp-Asp-Asp) domain-containing protein
LGTPVNVKGMGSYVAEDHGKNIQGNRIDIYFNNHGDALNFGRRQVTISYYGMA